MARKDEFDFDIPDKKEKPQREKKENKSIFGEGSFLKKLSLKKSPSDDFDFSVDEEKKEKKQRKKKESKPLFGEDSFWGGLFNKAPSFDDEFSFGKEKKDKGEKSSKRLKWWHILLIVLGAILIVAGIVVGILIGIVNENVPGGIGGIIEGGDGGEFEEIPEPDGEVSSVGTFLPNDTQEYILCEYTEYFSGKTMIALQKPNDVRYDYKPYWIVVDEGKPLDYLSNTYSGNTAPEDFKQEINSIVLPQFGYSEEQIELCELHIYNPVSFTRVTISEVTLTETEVTVKYSAGAVDGEMPEEYTLTGTYTKEGNDYTFTYTNLPEDEHLLRVAENLLGSARYESYAQYGAWVNELTFGENYKLTLTSPIEEE